MDLIYDLDNDPIVTGETHRIHCTKQLSDKLKYHGGKLNIIYHMNIDSLNSNFDQFLAYGSEFIHRRQTTSHCVNGNMV